MVQALGKNSDGTHFERNRYFTHQPVTWEQFKAIQAGFESIANLRLIYCEGVFEIMGIGKPHKAYSRLLAKLLRAYFEIEGIEFFPSGTYSQIIPNVTEFQSNLSYCFDTDKDVPDLCVEIVITRGSPSKLRKYELHHVPEVWFWEDGTIEVYNFQNDKYVRVNRSKFLPNLNLSVLCHCLLLTSTLEALHEFRKSVTDSKTKCELSVTEKLTGFTLSPTVTKEPSSQIEEPFYSKNKKTKERTIAQAILEVMGETNRPMTSQEICQLILDRNLYQFKTDNPLKMVRDSLWRHDVKTGKRSSPNKFFVQDGKYWSPLENNNSPKKELTEDADMVEFEATLYDYLFDLEDLENN